MEANQKQTQELSCVTCQADLSVMMDSVKNAILHADGKQFHCKMEDNHCNGLPLVCQPLE